MIDCKICGYQARVVNGIHLKRAHGVSWAEYKAMYPEVKTMRSPETQEKYKLVLAGNSRALGNVLSAETRAKMSASHKGKPSTMLGKKHSLETRQKMSALLIGNRYRFGIKQTDEARRKISLSLIGNKRTLGIKKTPEQREQQRKALSNPETREKMSQAQIMRFRLTDGKLPEAHRLKIQALLIERSKDPVYLKKLSVGKKAMWQRPGFREKCVSASVRALKIKPNKTELMLADIISYHWQYVGDGKLIIGNKIPDYWDGNRKLIELYGDYWHRYDDPQERIDYFGNLGYECIVIWEHELSNMEMVIDKIIQFSMS